MMVKNGVHAIFIGSIFSAIFGACVYQAHLIDREFSSICASVIRVFANLLLVFLPILSSGQSRKTRMRLFYPFSGNITLWLWGIFGALTVTTYFAALQIVGSGMTGFSSASSGIFVAALAPIVSRQRATSRVWIALFASLAGMLFLGGGPATGSIVGVGLGVASGLFGGLAYLMISRTRSRYGFQAIMFTWCVCAIGFNGFLYVMIPVTWPTNPLVWALLVAGGIAASLAQYFTTAAYKSANAPLIASLAYLGPVLSAVIDRLAFEIHFSSMQIFGIAIILGFGVIFPLIGATKTPPERDTVIPKSWLFGE